MRTFALLVQLVFTLALVGGGVACWFVAYHAPKGDGVGFVCGGALLLIVGVQCVGQALGEMKRKAS
jgi:hypothetical protein